MLQEYLPDESWLDDAQCQGMDINVFFPDERGAAVRRMRRLAKSICALCVVQTQCLNYALTTRQTEGIWGGLTPEERRRKRAR